MHFLLLSQQGERLTIAVFVVTTNENIQFLQSNKHILIKGDGLQTGERKVRK